ncbi:acetate--CoA ligase family protein [Candidatus Aerophobetes bacterium]|nr:acetate--CoA ligase family protein [Candidatus Aerophobetes bacterium]
MRLKEYEAKRLLEKAGISVPKGGVARNPQQALDIAKTLGDEVVLKAQILAGGRGLAGGIQFAKGENEVRDKAEKLFKSKIKGFMVEEVLVEEKLNIKNEYYISITLDRGRKKPILLGTIKGGVEIEKLAQKDPAMIACEEIDPLIGVYDYHGLNLFSQFDLPSHLYKKIGNIAPLLYKVFKEKEAFLVEINPLGVTVDEELVAVDCKIILDPEASYLEKGTTPRYIKLQGDIGIFANGAGLTMATMDVVKYYGGVPANFLEIGGDFYKRAGEALEFLLKNHKDLRGLLINLFGAYARTDVIAQQVVDVLLKRRLSIPVSFRIKGTGEEKARKIVEEKLGKKVHADIEEAVVELLQMIEKKEKNES